MNVPTAFITLTNQEVRENSRGYVERSIERDGWRGFLSPDSVIGAPDCASEGNCRGIA